MATILSEIVSRKRAEVSALKAAGYYAPFDSVESTTAPGKLSMSRVLMADTTGIIAEFKRRSPSKGDIHPMADVAEIVPGYEAAGAAACSVLTDTPFFGGSATDFAVARRESRLPLLRKEFIVDECQIREAAFLGANAVLLIASVLTREEIERFASLAHRLDMEVLLEIHGADELPKIIDEADMIGVNNRDLNTFTTDIGMAADIAALLPERAVKVAESGLSSIAEIRSLRSRGYRGFLIGETFMKTPDPAETLRKFLSR